jgi:hypothetical protein
MEAAAAAAAALAHDAEDSEYDRYGANETRQVTAAGTTKASEDWGDTNVFPFLKIFKIYLFILASLFNIYDRLIFSMCISLSMLLAIYRALEFVHWKSRITSQ